MKPVAYLFPRRNKKERFWISRADAISKWATTLAIIIAGFWALYHFYLRRESQAALTIDLATTSVSYADSTYLVTFDATLTNKGQVVVRAKRSVNPAFKDNDEVLKYGGDLLVRKVPPDFKVGQTVDWFVGDHDKSPLRTDYEADLLRIYRDEKGESDFWMEPGEVYHVGSNLVLGPGNYLVMVTFVAEQNPSENFWRRVFLVQVPVPATTMPSAGK